MTKIKPNIPNSIKTITDSILYSGNLPECLSELNECNTRPNLTDVLEKILDLYCEGIDIKTIDASEIDLSCLIEANEDISLTMTDDKITLFNVFKFVIDHVCYIYDNYCDECDSGGGNISCAITKENTVLTADICDFIQDHEDRIKELEDNIPNPLTGRGVAVFIQDEEPIQTDFDVKYGEIDGFGINGITGSDTFKPGDIWIANSEENEV